jgi:hypothetical protein
MVAVRTAEHDHSAVQLHLGDDDRGVGSRPAQGLAKPERLGEPVEGDPHILVETTLGKPLFGSLDTALPPPFGGAPSTLSWPRPRTAEEEPGSLACMPQSSW